MWEMRKEVPVQVDGKDHRGVVVQVLGDSPVDFVVVVCALELWE